MTQRGLVKYVDGTPPAGEGIGFLSSDLHFHWLVLPSHQEVLPAEASPTPHKPPSTED